MSNPRFSILIPVFNQVGKMDACIESVKAQTFRDFEVILVDDGSTDGSDEMLKKFAKGDDRFKIFTHETNRSLLRARFTGMKNAVGERVIFLDSDDVLASDLLYDLNEHLKENDTEVVRYGFILEPSKYEILPPDDMEPFEALARFKFPTAIMSACFALPVIKKAVELIDPPYVNSSEDTLMSGVLLNTCNTYSNMKKAYYHYTMTGGMSRETDTLTMDKLDKTLESIHNCTDCFMDFIKKHHPEKIDLARMAITNIYKFEMAHYVLNTKDEKKAVDYLNIINNDDFPEAFDFGCREVLTEFFKRKLTDYEGNRRAFFGF
ncbi:MAG: glycosyltransferase family 2 protein [Lachnospiraceae bacterium]|nr:glycosyltransferase family 2 protein [Lachnospiraceae bacterium]